MTLLRELVRDRNRDILASKNVLDHLPDIDLFLSSIRVEHTKHLLLPKYIRLTAVIWISYGYGHAVK